MIVDISVYPSYPTLVIGIIVPAFVESVNIFTPLPKGKK